MYRLYATRLAIQQQNTGAYMMEIWLMKQFSIIRWVANQSATINHINIVTLALKLRRI